MKLNIDDAVLKATTRCRKEFACLANGDSVYCPVEDCLLGKIHFVRCLHHEPCDYQSEVEGFTVCTCPTRQEIYRRYAK